MKISYFHGAFQEIAGKSFQKFEIFRLWGEYLGQKLELIKLKNMVFTGLCKKIGFSRTNISQVGKYSNYLSYGECFSKLEFFENLRFIPQLFRLGEFPYIM